MPRVPKDPVHILVEPDGHAPRLSIVRAHQNRLDPADVVAAAGGLVSSAERTVWDITAWCELAMAAAITDSMLARGITTKAKLET